MGLTIRTCPSDTGFIIDVFDGAEIVGDAFIAPVRGGYRVERIEVRRDENRGKRVGTRIYEEAARVACSRGKPLVSDIIRSAFAEAFWRKQVRRGRAKCATKRIPGERLPGGEVYHPFDIPNPESLPRPKNYPAGKRWPCGYWELLPTVCRGAVSLEGLSGRRRK